MKVFAVLAIFAVIQGSSANGFTDFFKKLGDELSAFGKDVEHMSSPLLQSVLGTLKGSATQLVTNAATNLISKIIPTGLFGKRDLGEAISKVGEFVSKSEDLVKMLGPLVANSFNGTVAKIRGEIDSVLSAEKPFAQLINEVKSAVEGHNNFLENLAHQAGQEVSKLFSNVFGHHAKRDLSSFANTLGDSFKQLIQQVVAPLKQELGKVVTALESKALSLLG